MPQAHAGGLSQGEVSLLAVPVTDGLPVLNPGTALHPAACRLAPEVTGSGHLENLERVILTGAYWRPWRQTFVHGQSAASHCATASASGASSSA